MKINNVNLNAVNAYRTQATKQKSAQATASFKDTLEISTTAQQMSTQSTKTYAQDRAQKVESIKAQVNAGEYNVDAKKVAEDMLKYYRF